MKRAWLCIVLLLATGCSQVNRPRLGEDANPPRPLRPARAHEPSGAELRAEVTARCDQKLASGEVHMRALWEYGEIRNWAVRMNPSVADPAIQLAAHQTAFLKAKNAIYSEVGRDRRYGRRLRDNFRHYYNRAFGARTQGITGTTLDLLKMFAGVLFISDGTSCSSYFLQIFYREYVRALAPFAKLEFGDGLLLDAEPAPLTTLDLPLDSSLVDVDHSTVRGAPLVGTHGAAPWITLTDWDQAMSVDHAASRLSSDRVVIDLRYATGKSLEALSKMTDALESRPASARMLILVNAATRGIPAVWARRMSTREGVQVLGTSERTHGYARYVTSETTTLVEERIEGLDSEASIVVSPLRLTMSQDPVEFEGEADTTLQIAAPNRIGVRAVLREVSSRFGQ